MKKKKFKKRIKKLEKRIDELEKMHGKNSFWHKPKTTIYLNENSVGGGGGGIGKPISITIGNGARNKQDGFDNNIGNFPLPEAVRTWY